MPRNSYIQRKLMSYPHGDGTGGLELEEKKEKRRSAVSLAAFPTYGFPRGEGWS